MQNPSAIPPKTRKHLSFDPLIRQIRVRAEQLPETRDEADCKYSMADAVMSTVALFALKDSSLLAFQERHNDVNMRRLFCIRQIPSDTQMREILDPLEPDSLRPMFNDVLRQLQRGKALESYDFLDGYCLLSMDGSILKRFSWVTNLTITSDNARHLVRGGRSRWKIENETFNTLKNQGYQFGHNFGHGKQNLSTIFVMLMMLAFLVDQTQELCCPLFQAVRKKRGTRRSLWDHQRSHFRHFEFTSMQHLHEVMLYDLAKELPVPTFASRDRARVP